MLTSESLKGEAEKLPDKLLVGWLGDDFTGAAAVLEILEFAGLPSALFLDTPDSSQLERFPDLRGIGIASTARTLAPAETAELVPAALDVLQGLGPELIHYKVCTTLDSSPAVGSIGCALESGARQLNVTQVPVMIAAPKMRRYQCFGHLFAGFEDKVYRLDQHPVMHCHPVTPMQESDVAAHLAEQTSQTDFDVLSIEDLASSEGDLVAHFSASNRVSSGKRTYSVLTLDCMDGTHEAMVGKLLWRSRKQLPFVVGSQGVEYALVGHLRREGLLDPEPKAIGGIGLAKNMAVISGSVSRVTASQIAWARKNGFACIPFDASVALESESALRVEQDKVYQQAVAALETQRDPLIYTAEGPDDPAVLRLIDRMPECESSKQKINQQIGEALGTLLVRMIQQTGLQRVVISGGDTSGYASRCLGIYALTALAPTIPAAPLFRAHAFNQMDGLEIALKGGQMGSENYFGWVKDGGGTR